MKNRSNSLKEVERFLSGEMNKDEVFTFHKRCAEEPELRRVLERESGFEALLMSMKKLSCHDFRFAQTVEKVTEKAKNKPDKRTNFLLRMYAIAATIVLVVLGGYTIILMNKKQSQLRLKTAQNSNLNSLGIPSAGKTLTRLSEGTLLVSEEGTKAKIDKTDDSMNTVLVAHGNICFDITEEDHGKITVATPHIAIFLSSAVVRVVVTELETEISVLDGSVEIVHRFESDLSSLLIAGSNGFADFRSWHPTFVLPQEVCNNRVTIFRSYVSWIQKQKHG